MTDLAVTLLIAAGFAAAIVGHQMERRPSFMDTPRLPDGLRLATSSAVVLGAGLRLAGLFTLVLLGAAMLFLKG